MATRVQARSEPPAPAPRRRWGRRLVLLLLMVVAFAALGAWLTLVRIPKVDAGNALAGEPVGAATFLLVGSDSRAELPDDLEGNFGSFGGERSDVVILARAGGGKVHLLSLPRDLKVQIPGHGTNKINAAYAFGGAELLAATVTAETGLAVHHVVEIDFAGFADLVDAVGGIGLEFPFEARDTKSGLAVPAGTREVDGPTALAYARSRNYQELRDGSWVSVDANDIGRTARQQRALEAMLAKLGSPEGIARSPMLALALPASVRIDAGLGPLDLAKAGWGARAATVDAATLPVRFSNEGGVSYVVADGDAATAMIDRFRRGQELAGDS